MPLNYNKWDALQLSDDSDIEEHPNVDKRSMVRALQNKIHEEREQRKYNIAHLRAQIACNHILYPRIQAIQSTLESPDSDKPRTAYFNSLVEQLQRSPSKECPPGNDPSQLEQTYDGMLLSLLHQVGEAANTAVKEAGATGDQREEKLGKALADGMKEHVVRLKETIEKDTKSLEAEEKEQKKHITSEDMRDGFSTKVCKDPKERRVALLIVLPNSMSLQNLTQLRFQSPPNSTSRASQRPRRPRPRSRS
ncbi:Cdc37 N terminal kinase binding-domain-containing protein [Mycena filopes]|nr:Cdc37 N terminal kinase binding-domain-containing protein [Mycena filopes]